MKKTLPILIVLLLFLLICGCKKDESPQESVSLAEQTPQQLGFTATTPSDKYTPLNFDNQKALWFTMMDWAQLMKSKSTEEITCNIEKIMGKIKDAGFNTVYLHVRPYNEAYYKSELFPERDFVTREYDPLEIFLNAAHEKGLSVHGWINPLRCGTDTEMDSISSEYTIKKWYDNKSDTYICKVGDRWYLNPAYEEVRSFIAEGAKELAENYDVDGVHIDDYFYPTKNEDFDKDAFSQSGEGELEEWRCENIDKMVTGIYSAVKKADSRKLFGISPQGNMRSDKETLYADVEKWCENEGYCDYIVPQLYYGFKNESMPFEQTLDSWIEKSKKVKLVAGICTYKIGKSDKWAGSGIDEWLEDSLIPTREAEKVRESGVSLAVYSYESLFDEKNREEMKALSEVLCSWEEQ